MTRAARELLVDLLALPERDRAELAAELIASLDGTPDPDWDTSWLAELDRRVRDADGAGEPGEEWADVRARLLRELRG